MKTAISIPDEIFEEVEKIAKECQCSRSKVFVMAVEEFVERRKSQELLTALNQVYREEESEEDRSLRKKALESFSETVMRKEKWE